MSIQKQFRRDTSGNLAAVTPADGEPAYNTSDDRLHMGDGTTAGGIPHLNYKDDINGTFIYALTTGSANAYVLTLTKAPTAYTTGMRIRFKASFSNTASATINVNSLGAKTFYKVSNGALTTLSSGDIINGVIYEAYYDGTYFQLMTVPSVSGSLSVTDLTATSFVKAAGFKSFSTTIATDTAYNFTPNVLNGFMMLTATGVSSTYSSICTYCTSGGTALTSVFLGSTTFVNDSTNGTLTGTTGTVNKITVRCDQTGGKLYIENRVATSQTINVVILGG